MVAAMRQLTVYYAACTPEDSKNRADLSIVAVPPVEDFEETALQAHQVDLEVGQERVPPLPVIGPCIRTGMHEYARAIIPAGPGADIWIAAGQTAPENPGNAQTPPHR